MGVFSLNGGTQQPWVFPTKNDHFGVFWGYPYFRKPDMGVSLNGAPNHPMFKRVFHYFHHPFLGETPLFFGNTHTFSLKTANIGFLWIF